ncbi:MAG TPA: PaaI family thioesterase [Acidimicrobiia bacterium]|nr:PaaI family thioesterase [Acidimicrobiia bacterium]
MAEYPVQIRVAPADAFDATIGFVVEPSEEIGRLDGTLEVTPKVCQPMGIIHGGVYAAMAETLASQGTGYAVMRDGKVPLGMSNNTSFLHPVSSGHVHASATAIHRGRTTWVWDVQIRDDEGRLCATSRVTIFVRDRRPA